MKGYPPLFPTTLSSLNLYNEDFRIFVVSWWVLLGNLPHLPSQYRHSFYSFQQCLLEHIPFTVWFFFFFQCHSSLYFSWKQRGEGKRSNTCVIKWWQMVRKSPSQQNQPSYKHPSDQLTKAHGDSVSCSQERGEGIRQRTDRYTFFLPFFLINSRFRTSFDF